MTFKNIFFSLRARLLTFVSALESVDVTDNACSWIELLRYAIEERFNVAAQMLDFRAVRSHDEVVANRLAEIEQHQNFLERHIKVILYT